MTESSIFDALKMTTELLAWEAALRLKTVGAFERLVLPNGADSFRSFVAEREALESMRSFPAES